MYVVHADTSRVAGNTGSEWRTVFSLLAGAVDEQPPTKASQLEHHNSAVILLTIVLYCYNYSVCCEDFS